ncbi:pyridoxamine kinase [Natranaerobius thermophilus]|uniref:pyridoxal kinase n=1 Tax=Natranaerobius thermophilus (strain ATCC BAA-1301 / DSM 18059 / JW/NM-WN-LF) TaxID=457570 RepID=B2A6I5_NATTJ|nr:pyridoxamine kinase [Natranaerobius thermophilus]ACB85518.1 Phosphomethylpyrimidine kinase type-1 [Natranaerobius thermophilus JW/NM-WN-LF]
MSKRTVKRVAAIHDLAGFGRSSLAVVVPIISTMGSQVCSVPTAVLSTHTGGFEEYSFVDLTENMVDFFGHWKKLNLEFDCIYSGFLGSPRQVDIISDFIDNFAVRNGYEDTLVVVDPVMADDGQLYSTMDETMVKRMRDLVAKADIITPNFTEACFLLDEPYDTKADKDTIKDWLYKLSQMGPEKVIITSAPAEDPHKTNVVAYNREDGRYWKVSCDYIPAHYPGTGDAFTSVIVGSLLQGDNLPISLDRGVQFITAAIRASYGETLPKREGVLLERVLGNLKMPVLVGSYELL